MRRLSYRTLLLILVAALAVPGKAAPAYPGKILYTQPDGTTLPVYLHGDEFLHYYETEDGLMLLHDADGWLCYAADDLVGGVKSSGIRASSASLRQAEESAFIRTQDQLSLRKKLIGNYSEKKARRVSPGGITAPFPTVGTVRGLIILAEYQDIKFTPEATAETYAALANDHGYQGTYSSGSVYDYFVAQSGGKFTPEFDVVGPVTLPHNRAYYGTEEKAAEMMLDACGEANSTLDVDFTKYDANDDGVVDFVFVVYAGYGQAQGGPDESVWPQAIDMTYESWKTFDGLYLGRAACSCELHGNTGTQLDGIGTICHEFSHILGLPDIYDVAYSGYFGMGDWDIMDVGSYNNDSKTPAGYTAMDKYTVGWIEPTVLEEAQLDCRLKALSESNEAYFIVCGEDNNEYFTLENRQPTGWDAALPGHGLLITHVHYVPSVWNLNRVNTVAGGYEHVALVPADNKLTTESEAGDPYPGTSGNTFFSAKSRPAAVWRGNYGTVDFAVTDIREEGGDIVFDFNADKLSGLRALTVAGADASVEAPAYNLAGQRVDAQYKGIVVRNGAKVIRK